MITAERNDHLITRNSSFFKKVDGCIATYHHEANETDDDDDDYTRVERNEPVQPANGNDIANEPTHPVNDNDPMNADANDYDNELTQKEEDERSLPRRSKRVTGEPMRYPMGVRM